MNANARIAAARAFVRSLNILLKFARMYDFGHPRTAKQYETAWSELRGALGPDNQAGLLLAVSADQLLLDGVALESAAAEKAFAKLLSAAGIASIHFSPKVTQASLARFVRGFPTGSGSKPAQLAEQLKSALQGDPHIHINEVCFLPADSAVAKTGVAAQLAARTLGLDSQEASEFFSDPEKLLQLIVAAEGTKGGGGGPGGPGGGHGPGGGSGGGTGEARRGSVEPGGSGIPGGPGASSGGAYVGGGSSYAQGGPSPAEADLQASSSGSAVVGGSTGPEGGADEIGTPGRWAIATAGMRRNRAERAGAGSLTVESGLMTLQEEELQGILQILAQIARSGEADRNRLDPAAFQSRLSTLPRRARFTLSQALSALAAQAQTDQPDRPMLLKLAEHIAVRFALESYERGDVQVNTVRQMLGEMSQEIDGLRKVLGVYEEKLKRAGVRVHSQADLLAQEFWGQVTEEKKKTILQSKDAWCVPSKKVREYVEELLKRGDAELAQTILEKYADCITSQSPDARRATAAGLVDLAELFAKISDRMLVNTIRMVGVQVAEEEDAELQSLVGAAFVRFTQEATRKRVFPAVQRAIEVVDYVEKEHRGLGESLRPRIGVEDRLPEFIEEALRLGRMPNGLVEVMRRLIKPSADHLAVRFSRAGFREDCDALLAMMRVLGPEALDHLRNQLRHGNPGEAIDTVGILARLDLETLEEVLPQRVREWNRSAHDRVVRQLAASGAPERGRLLLELFDYLDFIIKPLALDEIGLSGEHAADFRLLRLAEGDLPKDGTEYLRLKAVEALGRLRTQGAEAVLRKIAELRKAWRWANPTELRLVAAQAMERIDPEWARHFLPQSGLNLAEMTLEPLDADPNSSAIRQRRYPRLRLEHPVPATTTNLKENYQLEIPEMTLGGGVAVTEQTIHPGTVVGLKLNANEKRVKAQTIVRGANTQARAFEVVDMDLEERAKLRKLLVQIGNAQKPSSPQDRSRRGSRTIISNPT